jgi:hypothetical protein
MESPFKLILHRNKMKMIVSYNKAISGIESTFKLLIYDQENSTETEDTLRETRRANTLLKADKIPALIGTAISFIPIVFAGFSSGSLPKLSV